METLTTTVGDEKVLKFLEDLESLNIIRIVKESHGRTNQKLSEEMYGCISSEQADYMLKHNRNA